MDDMPLSVVAILHIVGALCAGGAIGLERTFHGRAAGFRTYALVCMGSAMAMLITTYPAPWAGTGAIASAAEPTRIVQGILTGIGFLGAGVIVKEGFSVRGLTTAASIWTVAVIGMLIGTRYYGAAAAAVLLVLGTLSTFRWIEDRMAQETYAQVTLRMPRAQGMDDAQLAALMSQAGLRIAGTSYALEDKGSQFTYELVVASFDGGSLGRLAGVLAGHPQISEFRIAPTRD